MGVNKEWKRKDSAKERFNALTSIFSETIKHYFSYSGNMDLSKNDPSVENGDTLARILTSTLILSDDENNSCFGADSVIAQKVVVENNCLIRYWGKIFWLQTPNGHKSYKAGNDPFYAEFLLKENKVHISKMKFADYKLINLNKVWWFDIEMDWMYEFEELNEYVRQV